jgi:LTXXQ motif family protein
MKAKLILITILMIIIPVLSSAQNKSGHGTPASPVRTSDSPGDPGSMNVPSAPASPAPEQLLNEYEAAMVVVTQNFSAKLAGINEAVQQGTMTSEQGKTSTAEQYLIAQMQFQLLSVWRQMDEQDLAKAPSADEKSDASRTDDNEVVLVELPFSSFELAPEVAERLSLTQPQKEAIQKVMTQRRQLMAPLMAQSRSIRERLLELDFSHSNKKEIRTLADAQAALLAKFIVGNARMQSEIYKLLTPEQQRRLDSLKRTGESGTVASK